MLMLEWARFSYAYKHTRVPNNYIHTICQQSDMVYVRSYYNNILHIKIYKQSHSFQYNEVSKTDASHSSSANTALAAKKKQPNNKNFQF